NRINPTKNIIYKTKRYYYLRYRNTNLAKKVLQMKNNLQEILKNASTVEKNEYFEGLNLINNKNLPVKMQQNNNTDKYNQYAKSLVLRYFGTQKKEFWDELPSLLYLCLSNKKDFDQKNVKFIILNYFKKYFHDIKRTNIHNQDTNNIEHVANEKDELEKFENFDSQRIAKVLSTLKKKHKKQYLVLTLRYGLLDGKEHMLTDDLSLRLFDNGIHYKNKPLSKSQTYQLLQSSLFKLRSLF
ncbi:MAG: hypothetical protein Q7R95_10025, partial [bacterium]|nr:hypothetical protein [bacterium]